MIENRAPETLYLVIPCYNEEEVLPETSRRLLEKLAGMVAAGMVTEKSRILFVDDGSKDKTWELISRLHREHRQISGPQPGTSERPSGGADDRQAVRGHGNLHGCGPSGRCGRR